MTTVPAPTLPNDRFVIRGVEATVAGIMWFAMDALAHWRLSIPAAFACWSAWPLARLLIERVTNQGARRKSWIVPLEWILPGIFLYGVSAVVGARLTPGQVIYATVAIATLRFSAFRWLNWAAARAPNLLSEAARSLVLAAAALWITLPLFSDLMIGGVDAQWYADVLNDFLQQWRLGHVPVFLGEGEAGFNGAVHPFRSAPYYQHLAGIWDLLTFRQLGPLALAHLTVITSAFAAAFGMDLALVTLAPVRRWVATAVAVVFITSPAFLAPFYLADQYLTLLAMSVMPLVVYGNIRIIQRGDIGGWVWLAVGLAWTWLTHPPQAVLCCLATLGIQGGRLVLTDQPWRAWALAFFGAALFGLLSCYYFVAMSEVPSSFKPSYLLLAAQLLGGCAAIAGMAFAFVWRRRVSGMVVLSLGLGLLAWSRPAWMWAMVVAAVLTGIFSVLAARRKNADRTSDGWGVLFAALLLAGFLVPLFGRLPPPTDNSDVIRMLREYGGILGAFFWPVGAKVGATSDFQPGWGTWFLFGVMVWAAFSWRSRVARVLLPILFLLAISCLRIPVLSEFWAVTQPRALVAMLGFPLPNRMFPPFVALVCGGGFWCLAELATERPRAFGLLQRALWALAVWSLWQAHPFVAYGPHQTQTRAETVRRLRPDNTSLGAYAYELMLVPPYVSHGKMDPRMESRLRISGSGQRVGPDEVALMMEKVQVFEQAITTQVDPTAPAWLNLSPMLHLDPGEHVLLRFEFLPKAYEGYLIFKSTNLYREYILPQSGWPLAFGVNRAGSKTLSIWNSGDAVEEVKLTFLRTGAANSGEFGDFGRLFLSHYQAELAPVRTLSLIPYRVEVDMPGAGWLETPRVYLPGYRATVDGNKVSVSPAASAVARVPLAIGHHSVTMDFVGTWQLHVAFVVSALTWCAVLAGAIWSWRNRRTRVESEFATEVPARQIRS